MNNHVIVCGYGRYGTQVCAHFKHNKIPYVVIEKEKTALERLRNEYDVLFIEGDATDDELLNIAGINHAVGLISTLPDDADNAYIVLTARQVQPNLRIISRAEREKSERTLLLAGADEVITPERIGGFYMASLVGHPDMVEFFKVMTQHSGARISFEELDVTVPETGEGQLHQTISELNIRKQTGANLIGIKMPDGSYVVNPDPSTPIKPHMGLIVLGNEEQIDSFKAFWKSYIKQLK